MTIMDQAYVSEFGWALSLAPDWRWLEAHAESRPQPVVTFVPESDQELSLTWMLTASPVDEDTAEKFLKGTMSVGPRSPRQATAVIGRIFPAIGEIDSAEVIELGDGSRALEVVETFIEETTGDMENGYQLILPVYGRPFGTVHFQRLCFYAPSESFSRFIGEVRQAARSFRYLRPFGLDRYS